MAASALSLVAAGGCMFPGAAPDGVLAPDTASKAWSRLDPAQRRLVEPMARATCGDGCTPAAHYASWPLSRQTTFEAATNGLQETQLTDASGRDLGRAIDLVASIDRVAGEEPGRRGDEQFRLYVQLVPTARATLDAAREFYRDKDNSVFHKGYPVNYRLRGRFPSVQISIAEQGEKADIDVDYLSSRAPQGLFNGHLTAANSDVRMRGNERRHTRRWNGLVVWWTSLMDTLRTNAPTRRAAHPSEPAPPTSPAVHFTTVEEASAEFLADWFVRREVDQALAFVSPRAVVCTNVDDDVENEHVDGRAARDLLEDVIKEAARGPRPRRLSDVIMPVEAWDATWRPRTHPFASAYTLATVDHADAHEFLCGRHTGAQLALTEVAHVLFQLHSAEHDGGAVIALLWTRETEGWRLLSFDVVEH